MGDRGLQQVGDLVEGGQHRLLIVGQGRARAASSASRLMGVQLKAAVWKIGAARPAPTARLVDMGSKDGLRVDRASWFKASLRG